MKKWKIILSAVLVGIAAVACGTAVGCKKHSHTYKWEYDESNHWRVATCEHDLEPDNYGAHVPDANNEKCSVCGMPFTIAGITVEKAKTEYVLSNSTTTNIATSDITVKYVTKSGITLNELSRDEYTLTYYKGNEPVDSLANATSGSYNIWASAEVDGKSKEAFVVAYVIDNVVSFERELGFKTTQDLGIDEMSSTWNFKVTYSSGSSEIVNVSDERIARSNFTTFKEGNSKTASVVFSARNEKGVLTTKSIDVLYNVTRSASSSVVIDEYSYDALKASLPPTNQNAATLPLIAENFTGVNAFIGVANGLVNYRGPSNNVLEIRGEALTVTFGGVGQLEIGARSTGNTNESSIALKDAEGNYILASYPASETIKKDDTQNTYWVTGPSGSNVLTFTIDKPGTYTICTLDEVIVNGIILETGRNTRIESIIKTDVLVKEAD